MKSILLLISAVFLLSGCVVRTYTATRDRVDQEVSEGNRGYLRGQAPATLDEKERKTTRDTQIVEIELRSPLKFEKLPKQKGIGIEPLEGKEEEAADEELEEFDMVEFDESEGFIGNRGYITESVELQIREPVRSQKYTVQKGDTLQKISKKFYGTTRKWQSIYDANSEAMKGPNSIYPGQVIDIPQGAAGIKESELLKETKENFK